MHHEPPAAARSRERVWFFDLDNTLHDASRSAFPLLDEAMTAYIETRLGVSRSEADFLRLHYWKRYGATLLGLERHHRVRGEHFLAETHRMPGLESRLWAPAADRAALKALPGRKFLLTNAPVAYARRVLGHLGLLGCFEGLIGIEGMRHFGHWRPKPDARMFRVVLARLRLTPAQVTLVEDTLVHQKAAHRVGMRTVWMQRYIGANSHGPEVGIRHLRRPRYVRATMKSLHRLRRLHV